MLLSARSLPVLEAVAGVVVAELVVDVAVELRPELPQRVVQQAQMLVADAAAAVEAMLVQAVVVVATRCLHFADLQLSHGFHFCRGQRHSTITTRPTR